MEIIYHGHSCIQIISGEHSLIIDPFLTGNPFALAKPSDIRVQTILLTHGHPDHVGDALEIAAANDATIICSYEMGYFFSWKGIKSFGMDIGGSYSLPFAEITRIPAVHGSGLILEATQEIVYGGAAGGFVIKLEGMTLLHAGDTDLFDGMKLIGAKFKPDVAFLPIGDNFTMGPKDAVVAAQWLQADLVVPIHYNSFPPIRQDGEGFVRSLEAVGMGGMEMVVGQRYCFDAEQERKTPSSGIVIDRLDHLVLTVHNLQNTISFYEKVLGMEVVQFGGGRYALQFGRQKINLHERGREFEPKANTPLPGSADLCFIADTPIDDVIRHLNLCGVAIEEGPVARTGAIGKICSVYLRDPDQNLIEISNYVSE
ncbi:metal-dependent hydrolase [Paenibacillus xylaniclasticus]|uniref:metal-dependent hydrolase n=1 Tax=Paenibacillus xylaniclasticus TaxID=588083 RepID=UPI000FDB1D4B|nr:MULTISPECIES: metal-dependent hydrolase [Paenibacillus]GFN30452.1 hypothetical protein PCURB6_07120 [Paenibacillus curdlanolyticus]